jgi:hypothetical protein
MIVTEAGFAALVAFLNSSGGRQWIVEKVLSPLVFSVGSAETIVWDSFTGYFNRHANIRKDTSNKAALDAAKASGDPAKIATTTKAIKDAEAAAAEVARRNQGKAAWDKITN